MIGRVPTYVRDDAFTGRAVRGGRLHAFARAVEKRLTGTLHASLHTDRPGSLGSREHYFHFLLGYLLPLVHVQHQSRTRRFRALDCGPLMTPLLEQTLWRLGYRFEIVPVAGIGKPRYLPPWDHDWSDPEAVQATVARIRAAWTDPACTSGASCTHAPNLLLQRSEADDYYRDGRAEIPRYGTGRRGIINLPELTRILCERGIEHAVYEPGRHSLGCQIAAFGQASRIVGMRGAEWANAIWSGPGLRVRILDPAPPAELLDALMIRIGIRPGYSTVAGTHVAEDPEAVARFFTAA